MLEPNYNSWYHRPYDLEDLPKGVDPRRLKATIRRALEQEHILASTLAEELLELYRDRLPEEVVIRLKRYADELY